MNKLLIFFDSTSPKSSIGLIDAASKISASAKRYALCINLDGNDILPIISEFDCLIDVKDERIKPYDVINITNILEELQKSHDFDVILFPATFIGRAIAPRCAMRLKTGLTADVTSINSDGETVELVRPAFEGKIYAGIVNKSSRPLMASIRPNVFKYESLGLKNADVLQHVPGNFTDPSAILIESYEKEVSNDIKTANVLVSAGGGAKECFNQLPPLAEKLGGMVAAGRKLVDEGIAQRSIQVGQSGKTVSPDLYIALGIYGSVQHVAGLRNVKRLIAVNTNKHAPICSLADIVVEGDALEFIEKLNKRIAVGENLNGNK